MYSFHQYTDFQHRAEPRFVHFLYALSARKGPGNRGPHLGVGSGVGGVAGSGLNAWLRFSLLSFDA